MIDYLHSADGVTAGKLSGFFEGWPRRPSPETHLRLLRGSDEVVLALAPPPERRVVGFVTAVTDGVLAAYIPFLEVLPGWRGQGIGSELVRRLLARLTGLYMIDVMCDPETVPFYARLGLRPATGASLRDGRHAGGRGDGRADG